MSSSTPEPSPSRYEAFTQRLFAQNQFSIKLGLDRMRRALDASGAPQGRFSAILVAGTNGKGTTASLLTCLLGAAGIKTGLYTSPHLVDLRERFRVDGEPVSRGVALEVGEALGACFGGMDLPEGLAQGREWGWPAAEDPWRGEEVLTFFELTTLMALVIFARQGVDVAVLEVGLGGRLDAVNTVSPFLSIITTIDLDHQHYLGDTLGEIAFEKAGIMRSGNPVLTCEQHPEALARLEEHALDIGASLEVVEGLGVTVSTPTWLAGVFSKNTGLALAAFEACVDLGLVERRDFDATPRLEALQGARWPGRRDPWSIETGDWAGGWLFDVAHNPAGMQSLVEFLEERGTMPEVALIGLMKDKDVRGVCACLAALPLRWIAVNADTPRALDADNLAEHLREAGASDVSATENVEEALESARASTTGEVLVCGSVFLLGEVLAILRPGEAFFRLMGNR